MESDGQGLFWTTVRLAGPTHYRFAIMVDGGGKQVTVADPYAREVRWDAAGPKAFYGAEPRFEWRHDGWPRPALRELVIYELCVRDFAGRRRDGIAGYGTFAGVEARLDHLAALGVNAIELMPITRVSGRQLVGLQPGLLHGAEVDLRPARLTSRRLVDAAHERGIAVILDMVFNHAWSDHPYYRMYPAAVRAEGRNARRPEPLLPPPSQQPCQCMGRAGLGALLAVHRRVHAGHRALLAGRVPRRRFPVRLARRRGIRPVPAAEGGVRPVLRHRAHRRAPPARPAQTAT